MKRLLICVFCLSAPLLSQVQTGSGQISVNESLTRIHIAGDAISPNLVIENAGPMASARVQVQLVDPSEAVRDTAETDAHLKSGSNHVALELRGWKQKSAEWNDSIWYRLRYKVIIPPGQTPVIEGVLALSAKADGIFDMRVVTSQNALPGQPLRVRIYAQSVADLRPMSGVAVRAELESDDDEKLTHSVTTDARGIAQIEFNVPSTWTDSASVNVVASKGQVVREASEEVSLKTQ